MRESISGDILPRGLRFGNKAPTKAPPGRLPFPENLLPFGWWSRLGRFTELYKQCETFSHFHSLPQIRGLSESLPQIGMRGKADKLLGSFWAKGLQGKLQSRQADICPGALSPPLLPWSLNICSGPCVFVFESNCKREFVLDIWPRRFGQKLYLREIFKKLYIYNCGLIQCLLTSENQNQCTFL